MAATKTDSATHSQSKTDTLSQEVVDPGDLFVAGQFGLQAIHWIALGTASWLIATVVLIYFHFSHMLAKPHYQYALFVPPLILYLAWRQHETDRLLVRSQSVYWTVLLVVPFALLLVASWFFSPWAAIATLVLLGLVAAFTLGGWVLIKSTWGICFLGVFLLPLPMQLDERLITSLKGVATQSTSSFLDQVGILHMLSGNVIELPEKRLFVADACSGIHSLFVLLAAAAIVGVWNSRGPIATTVLLVGAFLLVMIENIVRLFIVSVGIGYGIDMSEGLRHQALGLGMFVMSLGLILSFDQFIAFFNFTRPKRKGREIDNDSVSRVNAQVFAGFGIAALVFIPIQWLKMPSDVPSLTAGFSKDLTLPVFSESDLPSDWFGMSRIEFEKIIRVSDDPFGHFSQVWRYIDGKTELMISLNYVYRDMHDASACYRSIGWQVTNEKIVGVDDDGSPSFIVDELVDINQTPAVFAKMSKPLEGNALLLFSTISESGRVGVGLTNRNLGRAKHQVRDRLRANNPYRPEQWIQVQMVVLRADEFDSIFSEEMLSLFRSAQEILFAKCRVALDLESEEVVSVLRPNVASLLGVFDE